MIGFISTVIAYFIMCLFNTVTGAAAGWVVGLFFTDIILDFLSRFGMDVGNLALWQVGASLGFIGSYFKSVQNVNTAVKDDEEDEDEEGGE